MPAILSDAQQAFQPATQFALLAHAEALESEMREGAFGDAATQALARQCRYGIEPLQQRFHVSFETACHRL